MSEALPLIVLYIEDDASTAELFQDLVSRAQKAFGQMVLVEWAGSLSAGLSRLYKMPRPHLVVLDLTLSDSPQPAHSIAYIAQFKREVGDDNVCVLSGNPHEAVRSAVSRLKVRFVDKNTGLTALVQKGLEEFFGWWPESKLVRERRNMVSALQGKVTAIKKHTQKIDAPH